MAPFVLHKNGTLINSVEEWFLLAPPKHGERQWVDGRSAKELAKVFFRQEKEPRVPEELDRLFGSATNLGHLSLLEAIPEHKIQLDTFSGETRNADLACVGECLAGRTAITIEAKADESFGPTVGERLAQITNPRSKLPKRIELLRKALFGKADSDEVEDLRYQLLHGTAASLIYAKERSCELGVFIVYEFVGHSCDPSKLQRNSEDLDRFIQALSGGSIDHLPTGNLIGPLYVPGGKYVPADIPLYIGKVFRKLV